MPNGLLVDDATAWNAQPSVNFTEDDVRGHFDLVVPEVKRCFELLAICSSSVWPLNTDVVRLHPPGEHQATNRRSFIFCCSRSQDTGRPPRIGWQLEFFQLIINQIRVCVAGIDFIFQKTQEKKIEKTFTRDSATRQRYRWKNIKQIRMHDDKEQKAG